jgi:metal-responsive CopG/Arc/MetJ family transcriptional regulator
MAGKQISVTLAPNIYKELVSLEKKKGIKKSALITIAIEKYARAEKKEEKSVK